MQQRGAPFVLIGSTGMPSAFGVAAGVINPVTGRWMTKSWHFDQLLPAAEATYRTIEQELGLHLYHTIPELRFCQNADDVKRVGRRMRNPRYRDVLGTYHAPGQAAPEFKDPHGSFEILRAAYVDLPKLVHALRDTFAAQGRFRDAGFDHSELQAEGTGWRYRDLRADKVIFCEGAAHRANPWFKDIPLKPVKGETLLCQCPSLRLPQKLFHHKKWCLSYPDGRFRIGASYDESDLDPGPTEPCRTELLEAAQAALNGKHEIEVLEHLAGIRPGSADSRPLLGAHPDEPTLYLLNGLGSKGASTGPSMAKQLAAHLLDGTPLDPEINLARFYQKTAHFMRLTELVHQILGSHLREGDLAIDATAGNGRDTLELARRVGEPGRVIAIDIQESAVAHTRAKLIEAGLESRVTLHTADHAAQLEASTESSAESVAAIVFNLGYLPGSDKSVQTQSTHTLRALDASARLLRPGALLCVTAYRAHPGGEPEAAAVETWMRAQESKGCAVQCHVPPSKNLPPVLWVATKR